MSGKSVLIKGAAPIGFTNPDGTPIDIRIGADGTVEQIGSNLDAGDCGVLNADGCRVSPGWVDLHTHVYRASIGVDPALIGPATGVTTLVDAGSAGEANFQGFAAYELGRNDVRILCFLNIGSAGIAPYSDAGIMLRKTAECVRKNRNRIVGIKVLASRKFIGKTWTRPVIAARRLALDLGLPCMVHLAEPPVYLEELVEILGPGDVITHCYHGKIGNSVRGSADRVLPLYRTALARGIRLDVGHGAASFSVEAARTAVAQGIRPWSISTDLHTENVHGPVWSLAAVLSRMLACGLSLEEAIPMVTVNPTSVIGLRGYGKLERGARADFTIFEEVPGRFSFFDTGALDDSMSGSDPACRERFEGSVFLRPRFAVTGAAVTQASARGLDESRGA